MLALPGIRVGRAGLEKQHDLDLRGRAGAVQLEVNALGRVIRELDRQEGMPGEEVGLTIDAGLQQAVLGRLGDESASAVVLDCRNGEVLAMATNPSFDPSLFNSGVSQAQWAEWTQDKRDAADQQGDARAVCAGLDLQDGGGDGGAGGATPSRRATRSNCPGYLDLGDARFHCWRKGGHGTLDLRGGLKNSCDVFFYEMAQAHRHRPDRGDGAPLRPGHASWTIDLPGARDRPDPDARVAHWRRAIRGTSATPSSRHRPGLHPGDAVAARHLCRAGGDRAQVEPHLTRKLAGELQPGVAAGGLAGAAICPSASCMWCARACGRW